MFNLKTFFTIIFIFIASIVLAHHHGKGMMYHMYDTKTETTVSGTIEEILTEAHPCCGSTMNHFYMKVKSGNETVKVFLGPTDYVNKNVKVKKGDAVSIFGSRTTMNNETVIIAKTIKTKEKEFALRNDDGTPKWAGHMKYKTQK